MFPLLIIFLGMGIAVAATAWLGVEGVAFLPVFFALWALSIAVLLGGPVLAGEIWARWRRRR